MIDLIRIPDETPDKYEDMPEGLDGYWWETENIVCVPLIISKEPGAFTPWLKELEDKGKTVFFPSVINERLAYKLIRRGYRQAVACDPEMGSVAGWALSQTKNQTNP